MAGLFPLASYGSPPLTFIVNIQNPYKSISVRNLVEYYKKKIREWPNGVQVRFIDRNVGSSERLEFIHNYLKLSESDVDLFWIGQKLRTGDSMPIQVSSDRMVIEMVKSFLGAIGYIRTSAAGMVGNGSHNVKTIQVSGTPGG